MSLQSTVAVVTISPSCRVELLKSCSLQRDRYYLSTLMVKCCWSSSQMRSLQAFDTICIYYLRDRLSQAGLFPGITAQQNSVLSSANLITHTNQLSEKWLCHLPFKNLESTYVFSSGIHNIIIYTFFFFYFSQIKKKT